MEELNTPIFAQAKVEYTAQLIDVLYPHIFDGVKSIYDESKLLYRSKKTPILLIFRELLEKVPIWNSEIIDSECNRIINNSNCDWIDDLITAVFISHTKILTSIGPNQSFNKINITIPKSSSFVHKCYINTAREIWKNPYLFNESVPGYEFQKNNNEIEEIIKKCIENTIRNSLPIKDILKEHLEGETDSIINQKEILKQMLREELNNAQLIKASSKANPSEEIQNDDIRGEDIQSDDIQSHDIQSHDIQSDDIQSDSQDDEEVNNHSLVIKEDEILETKENKDNSPKITKETEDKDENISDLQSKIQSIVEKEKQTLEDLNNLEKDESGDYKFSSSDDPTEEQVKKECSDIVVNDITIPVEIPGENSNSDNNSTIDDSKPVVEIKYDNVDISSEKKEEIDENRFKKLMTNLKEPEEEVNVIKSTENNTMTNQIIPNNEINNSTTPEINSSKSFSLGGGFSSLNNPSLNNSSSNNLSLNNSSSNNSTNVVKENISDIKSPVKPLEIIKEDKPTIIQEPKSPRKEMVVVKNEDDIDETSSLANFFDDVKKIVEEKGIKIEKNDDKMFTLFEDANEVEK